MHDIIQYNDISSILYTMISAHAHANIFKYEETALSHDELQKQYYCHFKVKSKCRPPCWSELIYLVSSESHLYEELLAQPSCKLSHISPVRRRNAHLLLATHPQFSWRVWMYITALVLTRNSSPGRPTLNSCAYRWDRQWPDHFQHQPDGLPRPARLAALHPEDATQRRRALRLPHRRACWQGHHHRGGWLDRIQSEEGEDECVCASV